MVYTNPREAINILDQAVGQLNANRQVHVQLQQAISVLQAVVKEQEEFPEEAKIESKK